MAITRKIALSAQEGDSIITEPELKLNINPEVTITTAPQQYVIFRLVNEKMNKFTLDGICHNALNPKTGKRETMRLLRGVPSIWTSELTELLKDKEYVNKNRIGIRFEGGIARVPVTDENMIEFARLHPANVKDRRNGAGKYDFYEYNAGEEQKRRTNETMKRVKMIQYVSTMEDNKMIKLALFLGVKPHDDMGIPLSPEGYRTELTLIADKRPQIIEKYINSPEVEVSYLIRQAIIESKIDLGTQNGNALWSNGGGFICKIPSGEKTLAYLTQFAMTNSNEGRAFKEQLETLAT